MKNICNLISDLVDYALSHELIEECDKVYAANRILEKLGVSDYAPEDHEPVTELEEILKGICDYAVQHGLCEDSVVYRDLFRMYREPVECSPFRCYPTQDFGCLFRTR